MPRDERAEASIEKSLADRLNIGEVKTDTARDFQRLGDLIVDLLRVNTCPHPRAVVALIGTTVGEAEEVADRLLPLIPSDTCSAIPSVATNENVRLYLLGAICTPYI